VLAWNNGQVLLVRRSPEETVMPGMWELPELPDEDGGEAVRPHLTVRHAIMSTDFVVHVIQSQDSSIFLPGAQWFPAAHASKLPLTGLARKILKRSNII
jgi:hypothetical protein